MTVHHLDSFNRGPARPTDKRYGFATTDRTIIAVWADSAQEAMETIAREHPYVGTWDITHTAWVGTSEPAGNVIPIITHDPNHEEEYL